jgi:hypothetical protein
MNFHMNVMENIRVELHGILKTVDDNIRKTSNHVMMVQKKKKKRKRWTPSNSKSKEKISDEPLSSKPKTKVNYDSSPNEECFHCHKKGH